MVLIPEFMTCHLDEPLLFLDNSRSKIFKILSFLYTESITFPLYAIPLQTPIQDTEIHAIRI